MKTLDAWLSERLPITDGKRFYSDCESLNYNDFDRSTDEVWFGMALQASAYGDRELLSGFLIKEDWFKNLTPARREVISWVMMNPRPKKDKHRSARNRLQYIISIVATYERWGYGRELSVRNAVDHYLIFSGFLPDPNRELYYEYYDSRGWKYEKSPEHVDVNKSDKAITLQESLRSQVYKAIREGGELHQFYLESKSDDQ